MSKRVANIYYRGLRGICCGRVRLGQVKTVLPLLQNEISFSRTEAKLENIGTVFALPARTHNSTRHIYIALQQSRVLLFNFFNVVTLIYRVRVFYFPTFFFVFQNEPRRARLSKICYLILRFCARHYFMEMCLTWFPSRPNPYNADAE